MWEEISWAALIMALITLVMDWVMQYWLVIRWGPNITKKLVIAEFKDRAVAREVREALDLPTRAEVSALREAMNQKDVQYQAGLDARLAGLLDDIKAAFPKIPDLQLQLPGLEEKIKAGAVGAVEAAMDSVTKGRMGAEAKRVKHEQEEMMRQYQESAAAQYDQAVIIKLLTAMKIPPGMAQIAATFGPSGVRWALEQFYSVREVEKLMSGLSDARNIAMASPGVTQFLSR
jgi:hypothetical protein